MSSPLEIPDLVNCCCSIRILVENIVEIQYRKFYMFAIKNGNLNSSSGPCSLPWGCGFADLSP